MAVRVDSGSRIVPIAAYSADYQQLVSDFIWCDVRKATYNELSEIIVRQVEVQTLAAQSRRVLPYWSRNDWEKAKEYAQAMMRGDVFPPLIMSHEGGDLFDGFHRTHAYRTVGATYADVVYVIENVERFEDSLTQCDRAGIWS